jgi:hypothetical protein
MIIVTDLFCIYKSVKYNPKYFQEPAKYHHILVVACSVLSLGDSVAIGLIWYDSRNNND